MLLSTVEKRQQRQREGALSSRIRKSLSGRGTSEWRPDWALQIQAERPLERRETKRIRKSLTGRGTSEWRPDWALQIQAERPRKQRNQAQRCRIRSQRQRAGLGGPGQFRGQGGGGGSAREDWGWQCGVPGARGRSVSRREVWPCEGKTRTENDSGFGTSALIWTWHICSEQGFAVTVGSREKVRQPIKAAPQVNFALLRD